MYLVISIVARAYRRRLDKPLIVVHSTTKSFCYGLKVGEGQ